MVGASGSVASRVEKLRILLVVNLEWDPRLGAVRVFMELAEQWRGAGHTVEIFSASEAFSTHQPRPALSALRQLGFGYKAAAFVRKNANRFDVIDALIGSLHGSKQSLAFPGLLVARSVGLYRLYDSFDQQARLRWPGRPGRLSTRLFYGTIARWFRRLSDAAVRRADLVNLPNEEEKLVLQREGITENALTVQPYGLSAERADAFARLAASVESRLDRPKICFLGMWSPRKGSRDWSEILRFIWQQVPHARFCFLGAMVDPETIRRDLGIEFSDRIEIVSQYSQDELPALLGDCTAGAFPSYVEGFGIAVLEQLAAGIPTVAFDVPGPREMLQQISPELLVPAGDVEGFAQSVTRLLRSDAAAYRKLSHRCRETAARFDWTEIARNTAEIYRAALLHDIAGPHS